MSRELEGLAPARAPDVDETRAPSAGARPYVPPVQSRAGQLVDALVLLIMVFGALYAPVLLGWTSPEAEASTSTTATADWAALGQNTAAAGQWQKLGYDPARAAPLVRKRFEYRIEPRGLAITFLILLAYFGFVLIVSEREYRQVIAERFGPAAQKDA